MFWGQACVFVRARVAKRATCLPRHEQCTWCTPQRMQASPVSNFRCRVVRPRGGDGGRDLPACLPGFRRDQFGSKRRSQQTVSAFLCGERAAAVCGQWWAWPSSHTAGNEQMADAPMTVVTKKKSANKPFSTAPSRVYHDITNTTATLPHSNYYTFTKRSFTLFEKD